jgi:hypothetical protein
VRFETIDSAGVLLIRNGREGPVPRELLIPREVYRVGVVMGDPEQELWSINDIVVDEQGNRFVGSGRSGWIRVYDANGKLVREFGRHGEGPGDLLSVWNLFFTGDTLVLVDTELRRTTLFTKEGIVIDTWNGLRRNNALLWPADHGPEGWVAYLQVYLGPGQEERVDPRTGRMTVLTTPVQPRPLVPRTLHEWKDSLFRYFPNRDSVGERILEMRHHPLYKTREEEFGRSPMFTHQAWSGFDGAGNYYVTRPTGYRVDVFDARGRHVRGITRDYRATPITPATVEELKQRARKVLESAQPRLTGERIRRILGFVDRRAEIPLPPFYPPLGRIAVAEDGSIWVQRMDAVSPVENSLLQTVRLYPGTDLPPPPPTFWDLFDPDGRFLGQVELPPRFRPMHVRGADVTGVQRDSLDIEYVVTYRIGGTVDWRDLTGAAQGRSM